MLVTSCKQTWKRIVWEKLCHKKPETLNSCTALCAAKQDTQTANASVTPSRLEAIASRLEAPVTRVEAIDRYY